MGVGLRSGASPAETRRANAQRAVSSHLKINWEMVSAGSATNTRAAKAAGIQATVNRVESVRTGGLPSFIFVLSNETRERAAGGDNRTPQAKDCAAAWNDLFNTVGDYSVGVPARLFNCVKLDATALHKAENPFVCSENAPMLVLTAKNGTVAAVFEGRVRIKAGLVVPALNAQLQRDGLVSNARALAELSVVMKDLEKAEIDIQEAASMALLRSRSGVKATKAPSASAQAKAEKSQSEADAAGKAKQALLLKEYALLKQAGVPADRLPPEPAAAE